LLVAERVNYEFIKVITLTNFLYNIYFYLYYNLLIKNPP
jgi:hypothetical protein